MKKVRIAVLVSGEGTNFEAIDDACKDGRIAGEVIVVFADRYCKGIRKAIARGIPISVVSVFPNRSEWDWTIRHILAAYEPDLICLAGFMKILGKTVVQRFPRQILNIHPGLLPQLAGKDPQRKAIELGCNHTGNTVHIVTEKVDDDSDVLWVDDVPVFEFDTEEALSQRLKIFGYETYIQAINKWIEKYHKE